MSESGFMKFKSEVREALEGARAKRNLKRDDMTMELIGYLIDHERDDPIFRASQLHELFRIPDEIAEEENLRRRGYEI